VEQRGGGAGEEGKAIQGGGEHHPWDLHPQEGHTSSERSDGRRDPGDEGGDGVPEEADERTARTGGG